MPKNVAAGTAFTNAPLVFMQGNLVAVQVHAPRGRHSFMLDDSAGHARNAAGALIPAYYLMPGDGGHGCFEAYWCPYEPSGIRSVVVGSAAQFMFTATMAGCTLGVGSRTAAGERLVSHANAMATVDFMYGDNPNALSDFQMALVRARQQAVQKGLVLRRQRVGGQPDPGLTLIEPKNYRADAAGNQTLSSTTFGLRNEGTDDWGFYTQKYDPNSNPETLIGVMFVAGTAYHPPPLATQCVLF